MFTHDTSDTEQPIQNVDYSEFDSTLIPISSQNSLTSTQNQQSLSIHLQVSHLEVLSAIKVGNLSVIEPDNLSSMEHDEEMVIPEARPSRIVDIPLNLTEPNVRLDVVPANTPAQPNQLRDETFEIFHEQGRQGIKTIKYTKIKEGSNHGKEGLVEKCNGLERFLLKKERTNLDAFPYYVCNKLKGPIAILGVFKMGFCLTYPGLFY